MGHVLLKISFSLWSGEGHNEGKRDGEKERGNFTEVICFLPVSLKACAKVDYS